MNNLSKKNSLPYYLFFDTNEHIYRLDGQEFIFSEGQLEWKGNYLEEFLKMIEIQQFESANYRGFGRRLPDLLAGEKYRFTLDAVKNQADVEFQVIFTCIDEEISYLSSQGKLECSVPSEWISYQIDFLFKNETEQVGNILLKKMIIQRADETQNDFYVSDYPLFFEYEKQSGKELLVTLNPFARNERVHLLSDEFSALKINKLHISYLAQEEKNCSKKLVEKITKQIILKSENRTKIFVYMTDIRQKQQLEDELEKAGIKKKIIFLTESPYWLYEKEIQQLSNYNSIIRKVKNFDRL